MYANESPSGSRIVTLNDEVVIGIFVDLFVGLFEEITGGSFVC